MKFHFISDTPDTSNSDMFGYMSHSDFDERQNQPLLQKVEDEYQYKLKRQSLNRLPSEKKRNSK